ncbi:putative transcription factor C2H2 family [Helianthus debilis subsp. tardiflorus]
MCCVDFDRNNNQSEMGKKNEEPVMGIPNNSNYQPPQPQYYVGHNPYQAVQIPPNAVYGEPKGILIQQTIYRDTPALVNCTFCGRSVLTTVRYSIHFILHTKLTVIVLSFCRIMFGSV